MNKEQVGNRQEGRELSNLTKNRRSAKAPANKGCWPHGINSKAPFYQEASIIEESEADFILERQTNLN